MADLSDFKSVQMIGAGMASTRVTKNTELFIVSSSVDSKVMAAFEKEGKT